MDGLNIIVTSSAAEYTEDASKPKSKGKTKAKAAGRELISDAHLRLKAGIHYGLLGRNGTGKSSKIDIETACLFILVLTPTALLRAMAEKLIPGIPHATRMAILQQTDDQENDIGTAANQDKTVLESVLSSDETRNEAVRMTDCK